MDFYQIKERSTKRGVIEIYPDFKICRSKDLMIRGRSFYAIWDEKKGLWSTDEYDVQRLVDEELREYKNKLSERVSDPIHVKYMSDYSSKSWAEFRSYISHISDNAHQLDENIIFSNTEVKKNDYASKRLPYPLESGECDAFKEILNTLYDEDNRRRIIWSIGAIISGDAKTIQKFIVFYGEAGTGKSTILNIIQKIFEGYYTTFEAKALTSSSNAFATEVFKSNPLVAIQHDGDLSKIEDNTKLNSIVSHEEMTMNEKYKPSYMARTNCFLYMGTNRPVKITDAKSGIIRRLIDVKPTGKKIPSKRYHKLMSRIDFELGAIASYCLEVYKEMGKDYYAGYRPLEMILQTDVFFNFIEANYHIFKKEDGVSLKTGYEMYKQYCDETLVEFKLPRHKFREELKNYFRNFSDVTRIGEKQIRSYYSGFLFDKFTSIRGEEKEITPTLTLTHTNSLLDKYCQDCRAQYAKQTDNGEIPYKKWDDVTTKLSDIDTKKIHYVKLPLNHIVIDFDIKDENGNKSFEKNVEAASKWPPTYAELSKGENGIHLHYIYDGDPSMLSRIYAPDIEIKVFNGNSSLRRKLTYCNNLEIATINSGLPLKGDTKMVDFNVITNEQALRTLIKKNLAKEYHQSTKPSIDFIYKILEDAYNSGMSYDVTDMRPKVLAFANNSSHQAPYCIKLVGQMQFSSKEEVEKVNSFNEEYIDDRLVFYDLEVYPNLLLICWKYEYSETKVTMINPTPSEVEHLLKLKLIGFNNRRYDNHILYGRLIGYSNQELFELSQRIINGSRNAFFREAYNLSYTDVYDFSAEKKSLKKFEVSLDIHHQEMDLPWDQPVPEELWPNVAYYCGCDVDATEAVFHAKKADWVARQILSKLSGLSYNDTTNQHTTKIIFGNDRHPQDKLIYTDLSEMFPGYKYENGKSTYRGEAISEGGQVYSEPGMYANVALLDVASMHPNSAINLNIFGPYTKRFKDLVNARIAIKRKDRKALENLLDGALLEFYDEAVSGKADYTLKDLAYALKIAINSVYGLTSAKFDNPFKDPRNVDNIVAKRGALFMVDLKHAVQEKGFTVAHIKTDSIKIPNATPEIIDFVMEFGKKYGYEFEHEATYERLCLVNDAVYIAKEKDGHWTATGAQFQVPYVFKTLFSHEPIEFKDMCETKEVSTALYLDMNENLPPEEHDYHFIGKVGLFCPIKSGCGGGELLRKSKDGFGAATGSKGYRWMESEMVKTLNKEDDIDQSYYINLVDQAVTDISQYGDFEWFITGDDSNPPWECD